jgi:TonB family protein
MTLPIAIGNLLAASEQAAVIVVLATLLVWLLRLDAPGVRYALWRTVAIGCVLLPWMQRYRPTRASVAVEIVATGSQTSGGIPGGITPHFDIALVVLALVGAGAMVRLAWLLAGILRLRQLRRSGVSADSDIQEDLQRSLGTRTEVRHSTRVSQPVTFGMRKPVVLVPESLRTQPPDIQRAVIGHELIHVKRHDWAWLLVEEFALSLFWFHPAAWWVASRIQLAREEVVDELAVLLTGRRRPYVEALLAFSDPLSIVPTAAFARRRHLLRRIALISREDLMSSKRIVASCAVVALVLPLSAWRAVSAFPLHASFAQASGRPTGVGPLEQRAHPVTPENPVPRRVHYEPPAVPDVAETASGRITMKITVDSSGTVAEARPTNVAVKGDGFDIAADYVPAKLDALISSLNPEAASNARQAVTAFVDSAVTSVRAWRYDPPAEAPLTFNITIRFGDEPEQMAFSSRDPGKALRVGGNIKAPIKITDARPVYPEDARAAGISGVVIIEARIGVDGGVEEARVIKSIPALDQAALDAVKQWKFVPTLMNGEPVAVIMTVTINFEAK